MAQVDRVEGLFAWSSAGVKVPYENGRGCLLLASTTYYLPFSLKDGGTASVHLVWDASIVITSAVFEDSNLPAYLGSGDVVDVSDFDNGEGHWLQENPSSAYISVLSSTGNSGGATVTNATIAVAGGTAGGAMINIEGAGSRRGRLHVVVGATGGVLRVHTHGKS